MRMGIDVGTNSIGWALFEVDQDNRPCALIDCGVRIFSDSRDPESQDPLGKARREARQPRRQRDRRIQRKQRVIAELVRLGLMPADKNARKQLEALDPYQLRAQALQSPLEPHALGRAIFHLQQRRGFLSNRLSGDDDKEQGKVKQSIKQLEANLTGHRTLGQYWRTRLDQDKDARVRGSFWTARAMFEQEFDAIIETQCQLNSKLGNPDRFQKLKDRIFWQRPLKPQQKGTCTIDGESRRAAWAQPLAQHFRILSELNALKVRIPPDPSPRPLSYDERETLYEKLRQQKELSFDNMRKALKLPNDAAFNLESDNRKKLDGDKTAAMLKAKDRFGKPWLDLPLETQQQIVARLIDEDASDQSVIDDLTEEFDLERERAEKVAATRLPQGFGHLGLPVITKIVPIMRDQGLVYSDAVKEAGYHHSDRRPENGLDRLPYYGEVLSRWCMPLAQTSETTPACENQFGRIGNPTVHTGLNQLRKIINAVIARHGRPEQIHVELARELKLSKKRVDEINKENAANRKRNEDADQAMRDAGLDPDQMGKGQRGENCRKYRLWLELGDNPGRRLCPFSGQPIGVHALFSHKTEIEHLLPFARSLDDSMANKTVCYAAANRDKGERTPFEAFHSNPTLNGQRYDWQAILERAAALDKKAWRFGEKALEIFESNNDFLDRQLNDTTYFAHLTRTYLAQLYSIAEGDRIAAIPGRLTALLRGKWGLNNLLAQDNWKNRDDHRHHAIDAAVVACTDRGMLQRMARAQDEARSRIAVPEPFEGFRDALDARLKTVIASHKPDHGIGGRLHEETAFGPTDQTNDKGVPLRAVRRPLAWFDTVKKLKKIRCEWLRPALIAHVEGEKARGVKLADALTSFRDPQDKQLRRIRTLEPMKDETAIPVSRNKANGDNRPFKFYAASQNAYMDILELPNGKWTHHTVSMMAAARLAANPNAPPPWQKSHPNARRVARLFKGDLVKLDDKDGTPQIFKVYQTRHSGQCYFAPHGEGGKLYKRHNDKDDSFCWLMKSASTFRELNFSKMRIDMLGYNMGDHHDAWQNHRGDPR